MGHEYRRFGPPGTGKTFQLINRDVPNAVKKYGSDKVMITSFTRAAANEIAARGVTVDERMVGTLHSICWHALGCPKLVIKSIKQWNEAYPLYAMKKESAGSMDEGGDGGASMGDELYSRMQVLRAKQVPEELWQAKILAFKRRWDDFKEKMNAYDFTDLIDLAMAELYMAPNRPSVIFLDEAQDFKPNELALVRSWGKSCDWFILVGDDDQTLFEWAGASPKVFLHPPVEGKFKSVLSQSYRVPASVHAVAMEMISRVKTREQKVYNPRIGEDFEPAQGLVVWHEDDYKSPEWAVGKAREYVAQGKTVMFLTSCAYMLGPLKSVLIEHGIPFHNPYRLQRGDWNPLAGGKGITSAELLMAFLSNESDKPYWDIPTLLRWLKFIKVGKTGLIKKAGKKGIEALEVAVAGNVKGLHTSRNVLDKLLSPDAIQPALDRKVDWLIDNLKAERQEGIKYPLKVYNAGGQDALMADPKITIGTVHSVKGGESDVVFLYPDLSDAAANELETESGIDAIHRVFYVGITRARETLYLMSEVLKRERSTPSVDWAEEGSV